MSNASVANVAPVGAVGPRLGLAIATGVNDEARLPAGAFELLPEGLGVVKFGVGPIPFVSKSAWVLAAWLALVLAVQAVVVSVGAAFPWAHDAEWLVVGDVGGEAAELFIGQGLHDLEELDDVVGPAEPSAMCGVQVHRGTWGLCGERVDGIGDAFGVGALGVDAVGVVQVCREVWQRVRLNDQRDVDPPLELAEDVCIHINVFRLVLVEAGVAASAVAVVAGAVRIVLAANLAIRRVGIAVSVWKVVDDQRDHITLGRGVSEDPLERRGVAPVELGLHIDPIGAGNVSHLLEVLLGSARGSSNGGLKISLVGWVDVETLPFEGIVTPVPFLSFLLFLFVSILLVVLLLLVFLMVVFIWHLFFFVVIFILVLFIICFISIETIQFCLHFD